MPDADNAAKHGVAIKTIRRWRRLYQRRGQTRGQAHTAVPCHRCDGATLDTAAYAELLGWYLGDGHISLGRRGVHNLHVFNDERYVDDNTRIAALMSAVKPSSRPHTRRSPGCIRELCCWALDLVEIPWRQSNVRVISVSRREAVDRLDALIGLKS